MRLPAIAGLLALAACSGSGAAASTGGSGSDGTTGGSTGLSQGSTSGTGTTTGGATGSGGASGGGTCDTCSATAACPDASDICVPQGASSGRGACAAPCGTNDACASGFACQQFQDAAGNPAGSGCVALAGTCPEVPDPGGVCATCGPGTPCPGQAQCAASGGSDGICIDPCATASGVDPCKPGFACQTFSAAFSGCVPNAGTCP